MSKYRFIPCPGCEQGHADCKPNTSTDRCPVCKGREVIPEIVLPCDLVDWRTGEILAFAGETMTPASAVWPLVVQIHYQAIPSETWAIGYYRDISFAVDMMRNPWDYGNPSKF